MKINYLIGDATKPIGDDNKIIPHVCNNENRWGKGFVLALSKSWSEPESCYRRMSKIERVLGHTQFVSVGNRIIVANMIAQHGCGYDDEGNPPIRYDALKECLIKVNDMAVMMKATLHMPRIACGLSGSSWDKILPIIEETITVDVYVYDLK